MTADGLPGRRAELDADLPALEFRALERPFLADAAEA
jgi:hypothetical protein